MKRALGSGLLLLLLLATAVPTAGASQRRRDAGVANAAEREVVQRVNEIRSDHGLRPLALAGGLVRAARAHSRTMLVHDVFAHESPANGESFDQRIRRFQPARALGETIAWGNGEYGTPAGTVDMWMHSPPHRAILLGRSFRRIGVGVASGTFQGMDQAFVWTADLASAQ